MSTETYSQTWFDMFLHSIDPAQTRREVEFVARQLRLGCQRVRDICCGPGRHAAQLAAVGYRVTGFDLDSAQIKRARDLLGGCAKLLVHDMRQIEQIPGEFDAAILLWQS